ncbi:MAG: hypothetical protein EKK68_04625 [Candidatus Competibacteraceae bacterium]|nr:MAG: hypothetical protein EKK68_04625 [Candidatus Competibacteraceae bacterium]
MSYEVSGMTLIPQTLTMSCWYASAQMLIRWKTDQKQMSLANLVPPELDAASQKIRDANTGIQNSDILIMAKRLGLRAVPPMSPSPAALLQWLRQYGPLWVNGKTHIVVIAGIDDALKKVKVYDPGPVNVGKIEWRSLQDWYVGGGSVSSRDTGKDVEAVFLYCP